MKITISSNAEAVARTLDTLPERLRSQVTRRALNATLRNLNTELAQRIGQRLALKARDIKATMRQRRASDAALEAILEVKYVPVELKRFPHRQTKKGVSVRVLKTEGRKVIRSAFIGKGIGEHVMRRVGKARLPIKRVPGATVQQQAGPILDELRTSGWITERLVANVQQEAAGLLAREARRSGGAA